MARIPTYTASLTTPPSRTSEELNISSAGQTGAAMQQAGLQIERAGLITSDIADQRSRETELKYAAKASQTFTEESIAWQQANGQTETAGEDFKKWSDQRIQQLSGDAPNERGAQAFKIHVQPQANSDWQQNLLNGERIKRANFVIGEDSASQSSSDALRFRYKQSPGAAMDLFTVDLRNQLGRINQSYRSVAPGAADKMSETAVYSAVISAAEVNPAYAKALLNEFPLVDAQKREALLSHIKTADAEQNQSALFDIHHSWESALDVAEHNGTPAPPVPSQELLTSLAGEHGRELHINMQDKADAQNASVSIVSDLKGMNANAARAELFDRSQKLGPDDGAKARGMAVAEQWLHKSWKLQEDDAVSWQMANQEPVSSLYQKASSAFNDASKMPDGPAKAQAMAQAATAQDQAFTLSKFLQGPAPNDATPEEKKLFLNHTATHILSVATAENYAQQILAAGPEQRIKLARSLQAQYGAHSADFFADLSTLPSPSKELSPAIVQGLNIQNERHAAAYMQAQTDRKAENRLDPKKFSEYATALDSNPIWLKSMKGWIGEYNQRSKFMSESRDGILNYAVSLAGQVNGPAEAVDRAIKHVINDGVALPMVNMQVVPMARETKKLPGSQIGPVTGTRNRTDEEADDIARGMSILLRKINPHDIDHRPFVTAPPGEQGNDFIMRRIWTSGIYVTDHDGQSATLYIKGDDGPIQIRDTNNRPLRVIFDQVPDFTTQYTPMSREGLSSTYQKPITRKQQPSEFEKGLGPQTVSKITPGTARDKADAETDLPYLLPGSRIDEHTWNWPTTSPVFRHGP